MQKDTKVKTASVYRYVIYILVYYSKPDYIVLNDNYKKKIHCQKALVKVTNKKSSCSQVIHNKGKVTLEANCYSWYMNRFSGYFKPVLPARV